MRKAISTTLLAAGVLAILLWPGVVRSGGEGGDKHDLTSPESFDTLTTGRKQEIKTMLDSLNRAFRLDTVGRQAGDGPRSRTVLSKHEPDGDWTMSGEEPWDGKSPVNINSNYSHTPEQEEAFVRATIRAMVSEMVDYEKREELKRGFLNGLRSSSVPYLQHLDSLRTHIGRDNPAYDSIYYYRDSVYQYMKTLKSYRDSIYDHLLEIDVDSL